ncbi:MAG: hypothetical protein J6Q67_04720 [Clostridia bacterium]|nr:hypothetical protein [Clostridia bacterium]
MTSLKIKLCGKNIHATVLYKSTVDFCSDYLSDFDTSDISIELSPFDIVNEQKKFDRERELEGLPIYSVPSEELETLALYRKIAERLIDYNIILFHGSCISVDGEAYLFTAKSGTGKSTHTRLWRERFGDRAVMVNDDKPLIEINDGRVTVYGTPWNGKHRLGNNICVPLKAICILDRAAENRIKEVASLSEFPKIISQTYRTDDAAFMKKTLALVDSMLNAVKVYRLGCNMDLSAADVSYNGMKG